MEQVRCFIAIELPAEVKTCLTNLIRELKKEKHPALKWVDPEAIHLTLKFLGNVDTDRLTDVSNATREACQGIPSIRLALGEVGAFPNFNRPRVAWVGLTGELDRLISLQRLVEARVAPLGFPTEERPFSPHLTLARVRGDMSPLDRQSFGQALQKTRPAQACGFVADSVHLVRSRLTPAGAIYTRLDSIRLTSA